MGSDDGGNGTFGGDGGAQGALVAHIEENRVAVTIVTVGCSGACADVEAVATGGNPPYTFAWEDGSTNPMRHVCPLVGSGAGAVVYRFPLAVSAVSSFVPV